MRKLSKSVRKLYTEKSFEEATAIIIGNQSYKNKIERFLIFCIYYVDDARETASHLLLLSTVRVKNNTATLTSTKGSRVNTPIRTFIEGLRNHARRGIGIADAYPFGESLTNQPVTSYMMQNLSNWINTENVPRTTEMQSLLATEFGTELRELAILLIEGAHKTAIKLKMLLAIAELNIPNI